MLLTDVTLRRVAIIYFGSLLAIVMLPSSALAGDAPLLPPIAAGDAERKYDWVQLESGEWLKGEITRIYHGDLYFDSDEFNDVKLGWSDVASLVASGPVTVRLPDRRVVTGDFEMLVVAARPRLPLGPEGQSADPGRDDDRRSGAQRPARPMISDQRIESCHNDTN